MVTKLIINIDAEVAVKAEVYAAAHGIRACSDFGFEASMSKFCFKEGKICSCSRVPTAKILTHFKI